MSYAFRLYKGIVPLWGRQVPCKFPPIVYSVVCTIKSFFLFAELAAHVLPILVY